MKARVGEDVKKLEPLCAGSEHVKRCSAVATGWQLLRKPKQNYRELAIPILIHTLKHCVQRGTCTPVFTAAIITVTKKRKQPECPAQTNGSTKSALCCCCSRSCGPTLCDLMNCRPPGSLSTRLPVCKNTAIPLLPKRSFWARDHTHISCTGRRLLTLSHLCEAVLHKHKEMVLRPKNKEMLTYITTQLALTNKPDAGG